MVFGYSCVFLLFGGILDCVVAGFLDYILLVCVLCGREYLFTPRCKVETKGKLVSQFSRSTSWVPQIELRSSGLPAQSFNYPRLACKLLCSWGWPWILEPPACNRGGLGLQMYSSTASKLSAGDGSGASWMLGSVHWKPHPQLEWRCQCSTQAI